MRGLTLTRPWPWAILELPPELAKRIENRPTRFPQHLLNTEIALHAGKTYDEDAFYSIREIAHVCPPSNPDCPTGIVGVCRVVGWMRKDTPQQLRGMLGPRVPAGQDRWFFGPCGWLLEDVRKLAHPIPCRGMQGLWPVPEAVEQEIRRQLAAQDAGPAGTTEADNA
jgi:hypothetical protein